MEFLALMVALGIYAYRGDAAPVQQDAWHQSFTRSLAGRLSGRGLQLAAVLAPAFVLQLVYVWLGGKLGGLPEFILLVGALLYGLGRGNLGVAVAEYLERWSRGDFEAAHRLLMEEAGQEATDGVEDPASLHRSARRRLYLRSFERLYAVVFWFVLGGPAAALVYRLAWREEVDTAALSRDAADRVPLLAWLEWIPARLLALSFALVGDFDACLRRWREVLTASDGPSAEVLESCGNAALGLAPPAVEEEPDRLIARGAAEIESVQVLHRRALVVWMVVIALLAMIG